MVLVSAACVTGMTDSAHSDSLTASRSVVVTVPAKKIIFVSCRFEVNVWVIGVLSQDPRLLSLLLLSLLKTVIVITFQVGSLVVIVVVVVLLEL